MEEETVAEEITMEIINTTGRRKTSIARVYTQSGKGQITINGKELAQYFVSETHRTTVKQALTILFASESGTSIDDTFGTTVARAASKLSPSRFAFRSGRFASCCAKTAC